MPTSFLTGQELKTEAYSIPIAGIKTYLDTHAAKMFKDHLQWIGFATTYKVKPEVVVCIAKADSDLGNNLTTKYNVGNVGNNDRGQRSGYQSPAAGIEAIYQTLTNKYLGAKQTVGSLSTGGGGTGKIYASSKFNWNNNMKVCLSEILGTLVDENYLIRF